MNKCLLGDVAIEHKETLKTGKEKYPVVGLEHLVPSEITLTSWEEGGENTFTKVFRKGNVLFGRRRAYLKKAAVAPFDGICSGDITVIEARPDKILPEFLPFVIQNDALFDFAVSKSAGSLSPRVKWEHLKCYEFKLPSIEKQKELADLLWAIDRTKKAYQKLLSVTDELVKSRFIEMFGAISAEKCTKRIKDYAEVLGGYAFKSDLFCSNAIPVIRISNINNGCVVPDNSICFDELFWKENKRFRVEQDDILMAMSGATTGKVGIYKENRPALINQRVACIRAKTNIACPMFLFVATQLEWMYNLIQETSAGCAQPNISGKQIENMPVPDATYDLQNQFAAFVEQVDKSKFELEQALASLTATYKRIIEENLG
ncbi:MAG: restriction endonuclease subunit S [Kiritimatiellae bacterium]|nr:restriction endonuclease subunit S [Kiritimatiellia bacterium]